MSNCSDCPAPITRHSKTGRCRTCAARVTASDPAVLAKRGAKIREMHRDPVFAARFSAAMTAAKARQMQDPAFAAYMSDLGRNVGALNVGACHTPQARENKRLGLVRWCPREYLDLNTDLRKQGFLAVERKAMILAMVPGTIEHARRTIANNNDIMRIKEERRKAQAY